MKNLNDYIRVYQIATKEQCDELLSVLKNCPFYKSVTIDPDGNQVQDADRNNTSSQITGIESLKSIDDRLFQFFGDGVRLYLDEYRSVTLTRDEGYSLLKYEVGEEYKEHNDSGSGNFRTLSAIMYLNDDYDGGELEFPDIGRTIKPAVGQIVFFPSNFCFLHRSCPILSGTKYSVVTWFK